MLLSISYITWIAEVALNCIVLLRTKQIIHIFYDYEIFQ